MAKKKKKNRMPTAAERAAATEALADGARFVLRRSGLDGVVSVQAEPTNAVVSLVTKLSRVEVELRPSVQDDYDDDPDDKTVAYWHAVQPTPHSDTGWMDLCGRIFRLGDEAEAAAHFLKTALDLCVARAVMPTNDSGESVSDAIAWRSRRALEAELPTTRGLVSDGRWRGCPLWAPHFVRTRTSADDSVEAYGARWDAWRVTPSDLLAFPELAGAEYVMLGWKDEVPLRAQVLPQEEWGRTRARFTNSPWAPLLRETP